MDEGWHVARCDKTKDGWVNGEIRRNGKWEPIPAAELLWKGEPISKEKASKLIAEE